jgi:hypothetical protein
MKKDQLYSHMVTQNEIYMLYIGVFTKVLSLSANKVGDLGVAQEEAYAEVREMLAFNQLKTDKHSFAKMCFMVEAMCDCLARTIKEAKETQQTFGEKTGTQERMILFAKAVIEYIFAGFIQGEDFGGYANANAEQDLDEEEGMRQINYHLKQILEISGRVK